MKKCGGIALLFFFLWSCKKDKEMQQAFTSYYEEGEELSGGGSTVYLESFNAFGASSPLLNTTEHADFFSGNSLFTQNWVTAPSSTTGRDGLGPLYNASSCGGCHNKDGRGRPPAFFGEKGTGFLYRLSIPGTGPNGEPLPDLNYGGQIQDLGIIGVTQEADLNINYNYINGTYPDGSTYQLRAPLYSLNNLQYGALSGAIQISPRVGQQIIGLGLLEAIDETTILSKQDITDADGDSISGKANYVYDKLSNSTKLGRFGWKANQSTLYQQTAGAFLGDMGLTSSLFPVENCTSPELNCQAAPNGGSPEVTDANLDYVVLYVRSLAVPARRNYKDADVLYGKILFKNIGCANCHNPNFTSGATYVINGMTNQKIWPYTDMLLHDMGPGLADNRPDFLADGQEWRTQPLWGIGLIQTVNNHTFLLHDGRARNIEEAILWHGGEGHPSKEKFMKLSKPQRDAILAFVKSL